MTSDNGLRNKTNKNARRASMMMAAVLGAIGATSVTHADNLFWDSDGAGAGTGGNGNWSGGSTWHNGTATGTLQAWVDGSDAKFVQTTGFGTNVTATLTLTGPVAANSIEYQHASSTYTIAGAAQTLTLGAGGLVWSGNATGDQRISAILASSAPGGHINISKNTSATTNFRLSLANANTFAGDINVTSPNAYTGANPNRIDLNHANALPNGSDINFGISQGQVTANGGVAGNPITAVIGANSVINFNSTGVGTFTGSLGAAPNNTLQIDGLVTGNANVNFLTNVGGGNGLILLNQANTWTGATMLNTQVQNGHVRLGVNNALPTTTDLQIGAATGTLGTGALDLFGKNQSIRSLKTGSGVTGIASAGIVNSGAGTSTLTITGNSTTTYDSTIGTPIPPTTNLGSAPNNIALVLSNTHTGSLTLTRVSDYTGGTTINGGGLIVNNSPLDGGATGNGPVAVNAGSIGGSGRIQGNVTLAPGAVTFNPGAVGGAEDIQLDGGLTLSSGNILNYDFAPTLQDRINVAGELALPGSGDIDINLNNLGGLVTGTYPLINYGTLTGNFSTLSIGTAPGGATYTLVNSGASIDLQVLSSVANRNWTGATNNVWDVNTTSNWSGAGSKFINGDQATFNDSGANTTITVVAGGVNPSGMTFANDGVTYTLNGGAIGGTGGLTKTGTGLVVLNNSNTFTGAVTVGAGTLALSSGNAIAGASALNISNNATLQANGAVATNKPVTIDTGGATMNTNGNSITLSGALSGGGLLTKTGTGVLTLAGSSPAFNGGTQIDAGTVRVTSASGADNVTGVGTGLITINNGGTFHIDNINMGTSTVGAANGASMVLNGGSTLLASGTSSYGKSGGFQVAVGAGTVNINTVNAGDLLTFKNSLRRLPAGAGDTNATIRVGGLGRVLIESGPVSSANTYSGSWDVASGILQLGPVDPAGFGEALNGPGFKESDPKNGNTITVSGGTLAGAVNVPNPLSSAAATTPNYFRANVVMSGGKLASTGLDANYGGDLTTAAGTTSQVLVSDPVVAATPRNVNLVAGAAGANNNAASTNWNGTLVVTPGAIATGGAFNITRDGGTVTVTPGAALQIDSGATVNLNGTADALSSGSDHVNVVNNGTFNVSNGVKNVGNISGTTGATTVSGGATLNANHVRGGSLTADNSTVVIRPSGSVAAGTSKLTNLTITGAGKVDLKDNKIVTDKALGTFTGGAYTGVQGDIARAYNFGAWDQPGLMTSMPDAGPLVGTTTIGASDGASVLFLGPTETGTFGGQTVTGATTLAVYTYAGDVNFDGLVDAADYGVIDNWVQFPGTSGYANGDFNYDGVIDAGDYGIIDNTIQLQGAPIPMNGAVADSGLSGVTAVPEPASLSIIGLAAASLLGRRRRRAK